GGGQLVAEAGVMALAAATAARASTKRMSFLRMTVLLQGKRVFRQRPAPVFALSYSCRPRPSGGGAARRGTAGETPRCTSCRSAGDGSRSRQRRGTARGRACETH